MRFRNQLIMRFSDIVSCECKACYEMHLQNLSFEETHSNEPEFLKQFHSNIKNLNSLDIRIVPDDFEPFASDKYEYL
jgi:EAL domain-containing protein (putative c-di-GMP-specific phosphodiesterase class I)